MSPKSKARSRAHVEQEEEPTQVLGTPPDSPVKSKRHKTNDSKDVKSKHSKEDASWEDASEIAAAAAAAASSRAEEDRVEGPSDREVQEMESIGHSAPAAPSVPPPSSASSSSSSSSSSSNSASSEESPQSAAARAPLASSQIDLKHSSSSADDALFEAGLITALEAEEKQREQGDLKMVNAESIYANDREYFRNYVLPDGSLALGFKRVKYKIREKTIEKTEMIDMRKGPNFGMKTRVRTPFMLLGAGTKSWPFGNFTPMDAHPPRDKNLEVHDISKAKLRWNLTIKPWNSHRLSDDGNFDRVGVEFRDFMCKLFRIYMEYASKNRQRAASRWNEHRENENLMKGLEIQLQQSLGRAPKTEETTRAAFDNWYKRLPKKFFASKEKVDSATACEEKGDSMMVIDYAVSQYAKEGENKKFQIASIDEIPVRPTHADRDKYMRMFVGPLISPPTGIDPLFPNNKPLRDGAVVVNSSHKIIPWPDRESFTAGSVASFVFTWADDIEDKADAPVYGNLFYEEATVIKNNVRPLRERVSEAVPGAKPFQAPATWTPPLLLTGEHFRNPFAPDNLLKMQQDRKKNQTKALPAPN